MSNDKIQGWHAYKCPDCGGTHVMRLLVDCDPPLYECLDCKRISRKSSHTCQECNSILVRGTRMRPSVPPQVLYRCPTCNISTYIEEDT